MAKQEQTTTIRRYSPATDAASLKRLAGRDSQIASLEADYLVAEREGSLISAVRLDTLETIADPFTHTKALVEMLIAEAKRMRGIEHEGRARVRRYLPLPAAWGSVDSLAAVLRGGGT